MNNVFDVKRPLFGLRLNKNTEHVNTQIGHGKDIIKILICCVFLFSVLLELCWPSVCAANPVLTVEAPLLLALPFLFIAEGVVIVLLAKSSEPYQIRFVTVWFFVTLLTFIGLFVWLGFMGGLTKNENALTEIGALIFGEFLVVFVEAAVIHRLLQWRFVTRNLSASPSFNRSLFYSVIANLVSFGIGFISFLIPS